MKRTPLRRRAPLRRRSSIRSRTLTDVQRAELSAVRQDVFTRDPRCLLAGGHPVFGSCFGGPTVHHLRKASAGGGYDLANLVHLCAHHNGHVEDHPNAAAALGLVCRRGETLADVWQRLHTSGLVDTIPPYAATAT